MDMFDLEDLPDQGGRPTFVADIEGVMAGGLLGVAGGEDSLS